MQRSAENKASARNVLAALTAFARSCALHTPLSRPTSNAVDVRPSSVAPSLCRLCGVWPAAGRLPRKRPR